MAEKMYSSMQMEFQGGSRPLSLSFDIAAHSAAQKWAYSLERAIQTSQLLERKRWYNFPGKTLGSLESVASALNKVIEDINKIHSNLIADCVDLYDIQRSVNRLHVHFADSHLVQQRITAESYPLWFEFNNLLHAFEAVERSQKSELESGLPDASIVFTWEQNFRQPLKAPDYTEFTVAKKFGTCYINYCQVGRHLYEMFQAQDCELSKEHIQPLRNLSADTYLWLGPTTGPQSLKRRSMAIEQWFLENEGYFADLGLKWGDPQLAIGWIPVASLRGDFSTFEAQKSLLLELNQHHSVQSCTIQATEHN